MTKVVVLQDQNHLTKSWSIIKTKTQTIQCKRKAYHLKYQVNRFHTDSTLQYNKSTLQISRINQWLYRKLPRKERGSAPKRCIASTVDTKE